MRLLRVTVISCLLCAVPLFLESCASQQTEDVSPDVTDATSDVPPPTAAAAAAGDTSEADLNNPGAPAPEPASPTQAAPPEDKSAEMSLDTPPQTDAANAPLPAPAPPAPEAAPGEQVPPPEQTAADMSGPPARITALDYKGNINGGTIVIRTSKPVTYSTRKNSKTNQYILELPNTTIPKQFRRPYDTKEFNGPIASINGYQSSGAARIVVQLREAVEPGIVQSGNVISIAGQGGAGTGGASGAGDAAVAAGDGAPQEVAQPEPEQVEEIRNGELSAKDDAALQTSSGEDFALGSSNKFYGRPISLELKDADIRDVFAFISEESGLNIIVGDDVNGHVTLKLRKIPWDQALQVVLQTKSLGYVRQGRILRISPLSTIQRETDQAKQVLESQRNLQPLHVQVFPISYADVGQIDAQTKDFLSPRGKSRGDKRTNNLVVTDIDENLVRIKALIKRLDTQTPQVLIEAKVIEASENYNRLIGVNWNFNGNQVDTGLSNSTGQAILMTPNLSSGAAANGSFLTAGFTMGTLDVFGDITASLSLLETEGLAKILSSPRIVTLDRQEADIKQSTQIPYFTTTLTTTTATGTTATTAIPVTTVNFVNVALELKVKPQITVSGSVIMDIDLTRQFADPAITVGQSSAPPIETREAKTQVLIENGDTIVIGGIYQTDTADSESGVPWLRKIPLIGWLFKNQTVSRTKNELVMFLTPRILNRDKVFDKVTDIGPAPGSTAPQPAPKAENENPGVPVPKGTAPEPTAPGGAG